MVARWLFVYFGMTPNIRNYKMERVRFYKKEHETYIVYDGSQLFFYEHNMNEVDNRITEWKDAYNRRHNPGQ